jgi:hypothetical protein
MAGPGYTGDVNVFGPNSEFGPGPPGSSGSGGGKSGGGSGFDFTPLLEALLANMGGKKGGGGTAEVVPGFEFIGPTIQSILSQSLQVSSPFADVLPQIADVRGAKEGQFARDKIGQALAPLAGIFGTATGALHQGLTEGFEGVSQDLLGDFEALLRPTTERSKDIFTADTLERSAVTGQTRSSGTVATLGRGFADIENQLAQNIAGITSQLTPAFLQARLGAIGQGLQVPGQILPFLQAPIEDAFRATQFALGLPSQAAQGTGSLLNALPIQQGQSGKGKGGENSSAFGGGTKGKG